MTGGGATPKIINWNVTTGSPAVELVFDSIIPLQEWVTIRADLASKETGMPILVLPAGYQNCDGLGNCGPGAQEPDRVDIGFLPADVDQNTKVGPFDLLKFRQYVNGIAVPPIGTVPDYIDINRSGKEDPFDLLALRQLVNGVKPSTRVWNGQATLSPQP